MSLKCQLPNALKSIEEFGIEKEVSYIFSATNSKVSAPEGHPISYWP
jgi:hypothetical protein